MKEVWSNSHVRLDKNSSKIPGDAGQNLALFYAARRYLNRRIRRRIEPDR